MVLLLVRFARRACVSAQESIISWGERSEGSMGTRDVASARRIFREDEIARRCRLMAGGAAIGPCAERRETGGGGVVVELGIAPVIGGGKALAVARHHIDVVQGVRRLDGKGGG